MADIVVTTSLDVVDANDGVISLREAIEMANANVDADTITFDASLDGEEINLQSELVITQGTVTINGDVDGDGNVDVVISGDSNDNGMADAGDTNIMTINASATVNLDSVHLTEGYARGADGGYGSGYSGSYNGSNASAGITNSGTLTITDSIISDNTAIGGDGFDFGYDANGGNGGSAVAGILNNTGAVLSINDTLFEDNVASAGNASNGTYVRDQFGDGYDGYNGFNGGDGGSASSGIANFGLLNSNNVLFDGGQATGGNGGNGSSGSNGTDGGSARFNYDGGNGGNGGDGGDGGDATLGILNGNTGTLTGNYTGSYSGTATAGSAGNGGNPGSGGAGGSYYDPATMATYNGLNGFSGSAGSPGIVGQTGNTYFNQSGDVSGFTDTGSAPFNHGGVIATAGDDILTANSGQQTMIGLAGDDTFNGGFSTDTIFAGAGNDLIQVTGNSYFDNVHGGSGVDTLDHSNANAYSGSDTFNFATGEMTFTSTSQGILEVSGIEIFLDNNNSNTIIASDTGMTINGNGGEDTISGGMGIDILDGGTGDDIINGGGGDDVLNGGANFALSTSFDPVTLSGGVAVINTELTNVNGSELLNNFIFSSDGSNPISIFTGIAGNEMADSDFDTEIFVFEVNPDGTLGDLVDTSDDINFGSGDSDSRLDFASLPAGDYVVVVGAFNLTEEEARAGLNVNTGSGDFQLTIAGATDVGILPSGPLVSGNDTLNGGAGADILNGGDGIDTASYEDSAAGVTVFTSGRGGRGGDGQGDRLTDIENIIGSDHQDQIVLNAATAVDNTVNAGAGDDRIRERDGGTNVLNGEDGDDNIFGGDGSDTLNGGNDEDNLFGGQGEDILNGGDDDARDVLFGGSQDDELNGGGGNDALRGNTGEDTLNGGDGTDNLQGGNQNDILNGDAGVDTLDGGAGNDTLNGGTGNDRLTGGGSNDLFIFEDGSGVDRITDFNFGSGDQIDLTDFNLADFDAVMALATEVNGDVRIQLDGDDRLILENITLAELDANDFILSAPVM